VDRNTPGASSGTSVLTEQDVAQQTGLSADHVKQFCQELAPAYLEQIRSWARDKGFTTTTEGGRDQT
jgi:hypothetical protein